MLLVPYLPPKYSECFIVVYMILMYPQEMFELVFLLWRYMNIESCGCFGKIIAFQTLKINHWITEYAELEDTHKSHRVQLAE